MPPPIKVVGVEAALHEVGGYGHRGRRGGGGDGGALRHHLGQAKAKLEKKCIKFFDVKIFKRLK